MEDRSLIQLIPLLWDQKRLILGSTFISGLVIAIVMMLQPNYYESSTTFYPVNNALLKPNVQANNLTYYGDDGDVDRLMSMALSSDMIEELVEEHKLADHYNISNTDKRSRAKLFKCFRKLYKVQRTAYDAIELSVEDIDPNMAQRLTIAALDKIDKKAISVVTKAQNRMINQLSVSLKANTRMLNMISDSLQQVKNKYGIYSSDTQAEALTTLEIKSPSSQILKEKIRKYSAGIAIVTNLETIQRKLNQEISNITVNLQQLKTSTSTENPSIHIIEKADLPIEKVRPKRSLYILGAMTLTGILAISLVLIRESLTSYQ